MLKLLWLVGTTIGGAIGWWLGSHVGLLTAGFLSLVGTAFGTYWARRFVAEHL
jgi:hypothetical protein